MYSCEYILIVFQKPNSLQSFRPAILTINCLSINMITVVKSKLPIAIPATVQRRAGLNTVAQRRLIDARLAEARKGPPPQVVVSRNG